MKPSSRRSGNKKGAVLFTAVAVMLMLSILLTATISFVAVNKQTTNDNYKSQQAYLTASSTLESFIAQIQTDTAPTTDPAGMVKQKNAIDNLKKLANNNGGKGTTTTVSYNAKTDNTDNMGTTTITVAWDGSSTTAMVVTCETTYLGQTEQVAAHITTQSNVKPAEFNNTIELTGSGDVNYDNLNVIGDMAGINNTTGKIYNFTNNTSIYGSYLMYGSLKNGNHLNIYLKPSLVDSSKGSSITVSENFYANTNDQWIRSSMARADGYNYVNIGKTFNCTNAFKVGSSGCEIDVYCTDATITGNGGYEQYGNLYVYKDSNGANGNAVLGQNGGGAVINGNLYVEGNLKIQDTLTVNGNVYISGSTIENESGLKFGESGQQVYRGVAFAKTGRDAVPTIPAKADEYVYYPEDFLMSSDKNVTTISDKYKSFYKTTDKNDDTFMTYYYNTDEKDSNGNATGKKINQEISCTSNVDGSMVTSKYAFEITGSCTWATTDFSDCGTMGNAKRILIHVTDASGDIVIRLSNGLNVGDEYRPIIVVKNDSSKDTNTGANHKYNCYFVSDAGDKIQLPGLDVDGKSQHTNVTPCTYSVSKLKVFDYETYVRMYDSTELSKSSGDLGSCRSDFVLNYTDAEVPDTYKPDNGSIIFLLTEGTTLNCGNNAFIQASIYAPQAKINIATSGISINVLSVDYPTVKSNSIDTCAVGVFIAEKFDSQNKAWYVFQKPSASSILSNAKGNAGSVVYGYTLDRYDHY